MDISTKTSSTLTTTETNVSTQTQRNTKSDVSFSDEMNKFANESIQPETTESSENNKTQASDKSNKNEINIISHNKNIDNVKTEIIKNSVHNINNNLVTDENITNTNKLINEIPQNINLKNDCNNTISEIKTHINTQNTINKEMLGINTDIENNAGINKHSKEMLAIDSNIETNASINKLSKEMLTIDSNIETNASINKLSKEITVNNKTNSNTKKDTTTNNKNHNLANDKEISIETALLISEQGSQKTTGSKNHKNSIKNNAEKIINTINADAVDTQIDKTSSTPIENIATEAAAIAAQTTAAIQNTVTTAQNTDNIQTLIEANKQLADIALIADAKIADIKVVEKTSNKETIKVDYTTVKMSTDDAVFFVELVQDTEKTLQNVITDLQSEVEQKVQETSKNVKVSATLMNAISEAVKTNQPMRIDFDKDISIIIKIDKDGSINAKFIPGDKAVEEYLKQNISALRQRFDEQEINYRDLSYANRQKQNQENNRRNNKEKDHE